MFSGAGVPPHLVPSSGCVRIWGFEASERPATLETLVMQPPQPLALRAERSHDPFQRFWREHITDHAQVIDLKSRETNAKPCVTHGQHKPP